MQEITKKIIDFALDEDLGVEGDITSNFTINKDKKISFQIATREDIILCGADLVIEVFNKVGQRFGTGSNLQTKKHFEDAKQLKKKDVIISGSWDARSVFAAERVALNLIQHLSGISTLTAKYVQELSNSNTKILDTRKTIPALRALQKYAVKVGGGKNHRFALYDGILVKDNHIAAAGGIKQAINMVKENLQKQNKKMDIEIECDTINQVIQALEAGVDIIMLDNMNLEQIKEAKNIINKKCKIEVSGGITLEKIRPISDIGVDYISIGSLTHSVKAVDIGLDVL